MGLEVKLPECSVILPYILTLSIFSYLFLITNIPIGHCDLISQFSEFALYLDTQFVYFHTSFRL